MLNEEHKIDQLFREGLENYEAVPSEAVWNRISGSLDHSGRKRRMMAWWTMAGAAAVAAAFVMGWFMAGHFNNDALMMARLNETLDEHRNRTIVVEEFSNEIHLHFERPVMAAFDKQIIAGASKTEGTKTEKPEINNFLLAGAAPSRLLVPANSERLSGWYESQLISEADKAIIAQNLLAMNNEKKEDKEEGSWSMGVQASPQYAFEPMKPGFYAADADFASSQSAISTNYKSNLAGGLTFAYHTGKRLSFSTGINYNEIEQQSGDIGVSFAGHNWLNDRMESSFSPEYENIKTVEQNSATSGNVILNTSSGLANIDLPEGTKLAGSSQLYYATSDMAQNYNYRQSAGYVEVPLLMHYRLLDQRMGINLLGGVSTNVLVVNQVGLSREGEVLASGVIEGLRPVVFSSSMGFGVDYQLSERLKLNLEPMLKLHLSSLNQQALFDNRPYVFGLYSGLSYHF
jgi:hypothetical protein